jgi:hypothetical protein
MHRRLYIFSLLLLVLIAVVTIILQHRQLSRFRDDQRQFQMRASTPSETDIAQQSALSSPHPSAELLELRSKVTQLMGRKNELVGVRTENENLHFQLTARGTNSPTGIALPPDYIRTRDAQWVGASTPESTMQSFLWALRNHDTNAIAQIFTPDGFQQILFQLTSDDFFKHAAALPGMRIVSKEKPLYGDMALKVEMLPGQSTSAWVRMRLTNGEWKIDSFD